MTLPYAVSIQPTHFSMWNCLPDVSLAPYLSLLFTSFELTDEKKIEYDLSSNILSSAL